MTRADTVPALNTRTHTCNRGPKSAAVSARPAEMCWCKKKRCGGKKRREGSPPPPSERSASRTPAALPHIPLVLLAFTKKKPTLISGKEILTESPWPPCWVWRQMLWRSAGAGHREDSRHDRSGEAWDARLIFSPSVAFLRRGTWRVPSKVSTHETRGRERRPRFLWRSCQRRTRCASPAAVCVGWISSLTLIRVKCKQTSEEKTLSRGSLKLMK